MAHVAEADGKSQCRFDRYVRRPLGSFPSNTNISRDLRKAGWQVGAALSPGRAEPTWRALCVVQAAGRTLGWCRSSARVATATEHV
jgi:hypothetical protein